MATKRERALEVIQNTEGDFPGKEYLEALVNDTLPRYFLDIFQTFRFYSDDLPKDMAREWHPDYPWMKCRGNVITSISISLFKAVNDGVIKDKEVVDLISYFRGRDWNFEKGQKGECWTSQEEIELINVTLDAVIGVLVREYGLVNNVDEIKSKFEEELVQERKRWSVSEQ